MIIKFDNLLVQNAIYWVACKNEGFEVGIDQDEEMMEYYWEKVEERGSVEYGFEKALIDYLLIQGEFDVESGEYGWLVDGMGCEVYDLEYVFDPKYWGEQKTFNNNKEQ